MEKISKKEYILNHEAIAAHNYYRIQIHGIIDGHAYVSRLYQPTYCGSTKASFHKLKINQYKEGGKYIVVPDSTYDGRKKRLSLNMDNFIFKDSGYCISTVSCAELMAIC